MKKIDWHPSQISQAGIPTIIQLIMLPAEAQASTRQDAYTFDTSLQQQFVYFSSLPVGGPAATTRLYYLLLSRQKEHDSPLSIDQLRASADAFEEVLPVK